MSESSAASSGFAAIFTLKAIRLLGTLLLLFVVAGGVVVAYTRWRTDSNRTAIIDRDLRSLAGLGKQVSSILEVQAKSLAHGGVGAFRPGATTAEIQVTEREGPVEKRSIQLVVGAAAERGAAAPTGDVSLIFDNYPSGALLRGECGAQGCLDLELRSIVEPLLRRPGFDHIVIANELGDVLFQAENRELRVSALPSLVPEFFEPLEKDGPIRVWKHRASAHQAAVALGVESYDLLAIPLDLHGIRDRSGQAASVRKALEAGEKDTDPWSPRWVICGFVRSKRLQNQALALPRRGLLALFVALVVVIFAWPFVKLAWMGRSESLARWELGWLSFGLAVLLALPTIFLVAWWQGGTIRDETDASMKRLADQIAQEFASEIRETRTQLQDLLGNRGIRETLGGIQSGKEKCPLRGGGALEKAFLAEVGSAFQELPLRNLYWIDGLGKQRLKVSAGARAQRISVEEREYFRYIADRVRTADGGCSADCLRDLAYIQPIQSWTTAAPEVVVAMPAEGPFPVVAAASRFPSVIDRVMPPGVGFAIVQRRSEVQGTRDAPRIVSVGEVLLHSDSTRNLRENLLRESDESVWLRAALSSPGGSGGAGELTYQGRRRRAYVRPISWDDAGKVEPRPWSLVVFADDGFRESVFFESIFLGLSLFLGYGLVLGTLYVVLRTCEGWEPTCWLRPARRVAAFHLGLAVAAGLACVGGLLALWPGIWEVRSAAAWIPLYNVALLSVACVGYGPRNGGRRWASPARLVQAAVALLALVGVCLVWFQVAGSPPVTWLSVTVASLAIPPFAGLRRSADRWSPAWSCRIFLVALAISLVVVPAALFTRAAVAFELRLGKRAAAVELCRRRVQSERHRIRDRAKLRRDYETSRSEEPSKPSSQISAAVPEGCEDPKCWSVGISPDAGSTDCPAFLAGMAGDDRGGLGSPAGPGAVPSPLGGSLTWLRLRLRDAAARPTVVGVAEEEDGAIPVLDADGAPGGTRGGRTLAPTPRWLVLGLAVLSVALGALGLLRHLLQKLGLSQPPAPTQASHATPSHRWNLWVDEPTSIASGSPGSEIPGLVVRKLGGTRPKSVSLDEWRNARGFLLRLWSAPGNLDVGSAARDSALLRSVAQVEAWLRKRAGKLGVTPAQAEVRLRSLLGPVFKATWRSLADDEKRVLSALAHGRIVTVDAEPVLLRLAERGLLALVPEGGPRIEAKVLRSFVRELAWNEGRSLRHAGTRSAWQLIWPYLVVVGVLLTAALVYLQPEAVQQIAAVLGGAGTVIGIVLRASSSFRARGGAPTQV